MNENEHFWVTNLAFEGGGPPEAWAGGTYPPPRLIHLCHYTATGFPDMRKTLSTPGEIDGSGAPVPHSWGVPAVWSTLRMNPGANGRPQKQPEFFGPLMLSAPLCFFWSGPENASYKGMLRPPREYLYP